MPENWIWINRIFVDSANKNESICLPLESWGANPNIPGRFRTEEDKPAKQTCYLKVNNNDNLCNVLISKRIDNNKINLDNIQFEIKEVKSRFKNINETFDAKTELSSLTQNGTDNVGISIGKNSRKDFSNRSQRSESARTKFQQCILQPFRTNF